MNDEGEHQVSASALCAWLLWIAAGLICVVGMVIALGFGEAIWARATALSLFGIELIVVAAAAVLTIRLGVRRSRKKQERFIADAVLVKKIRDASHGTRR